MIVVSYQNSYSFFTLLFIYSNSVNKHSCFTNTESYIILLFEGKPPGDMKEEETLMRQKVQVCYLQGQLLVERKYASLPQKGEVNPLQYLSHWAVFLLKWSCMQQKKLKLLWSGFHIFWNFWSFSLKDKGGNPGLKIPLVSTIRIFWFNVRLRNSLAFQTISFVSWLISMSVAQQSSR